MFNDEPLTKPQGFITKKNNDTPWYVFMDMSFEKTFSQQREQLCTGHQKARERRGDQEHNGERQWRAKLVQDRQGLRKFFCGLTHHGVERTVMICMYSLYRFYGNEFMHY